MMDTRRSTTDNNERCQVRRAMAGDRSAFDLLIRQYRALILAMTFIRTGHVDDAEDLTQGVFVKAWEKLPSLRDPDAFVPWLRRIAANACRDWYRRARWPASLAEMPDDMPDGKPEPAVVVVEHEQQFHLRRALLTLPERNRDALLLYSWGHYSYRRIAELLNIPETTVEGRIARARQQLKRLLTDEIDLRDVAGHRPAAKGDYHGK